MSTSTKLAAVVDLVQEAKNQELPGADAASRKEGFANLLSGVMSIIFTFAAIAMLLYLVWGAIEWITSGGDKGKVEKARDKMTQAVIGIIVLAATTALFMLVQNFLGICVLNFGGACTS